jgi:hypothetical protein
MPGRSGRHHVRTPHQLDPTASAGRTTMTEANKTIVRRLVDEVFNGGRLEVVDELYAPELAPAAKRWITRFGPASPMSTWSWWS